MADLHPHTDDGVTSETNGGRTSASSITTPESSPPFSFRFLGDDPEISKSRRTYIKVLVQRACLIAVVMFGIFSIYWGALHDLPARSLNGWIVDFDGAEVGEFISQELNNLSGPKIKWEIKPSGAFINGVEGLQSAILDEQCWIAVAINQGTTKSLNQSTSAGTQTVSLNASEAISIYAVEARNENAYRVLLRPTVEESLDLVTRDFAFRWVSELSSANRSLNSIPFDILIRPVYFTLVNLRPFDVPVAGAVTFIGLIYLLILGFIIVNSSIMARTMAGLESKLTTRSLIYVRLATPVVMYFFVTLVYTLLSRAFNLPFGRKCVDRPLRGSKNRRYSPNSVSFGRAGFVIFWMLSWFGMSAVGLGLESMVTILTIKYIQVFLILWIIGNVSVCLWPIDALPVVYRYGHVAPFYQISRGVRTIVFSTKNELGRNFGILAVWIAISCITLPIFQWYNRRQAVLAAILRTKESEKV